MRLITPGVAQAKERLLKEIESAIIREQLGRDEAVGQTSYLLAGLWNEAERLARSKGRQGLKTRHVRSEQRED